MYSEFFIIDNKLSDKLQFDQCGFLEQAKLQPKSYKNYGKADDVLIIKMLKEGINKTKTALIAGVDTKVIYNVIKRNGYDLSSFPKKIHNKKKGEYKKKIKSLSEDRVFTMRDSRSNLNHRRLLVAQRTDMSINPPPIQ